jgi:threonylcarbamoyladenosine tRNA methylthiotransferase MtaB
MNKHTFNIINFGCRATQADGAAIEQAFLDQNAEKSTSWTDSDIVVINTCTVTQSADAQARQLIRRVKRNNPRAKIVVTGCYAQRDPEKLAQMKEVSCVIGNSHKDQLVQLVLENGPLAETTDIQSSASAPIHCSNIFESKTLEPIAASHGGDKTRPVLKVQDGCSLRCSYCVIPYVRGNSRSLPTAEVLRQVEHLLALGYREVVLTGIHLGAYGRDLPTPLNLAGLTRRLLELKGLERLRLSSIEPLEVTPELIGLVRGEQRLARHFHVPLQSGSNRILRLMRRPCRAEEYALLLNRLRASLPDAAIGADVMVGFPTESDHDFEETRQLLEDLPVTYLHVFPYSGRPGTPAAELKPKVPERVIQERGKTLRELGNRKSLEFRGSLLGTTLSVLFLARESEDYVLEGISSNYVKVQVESAHLQKNRIYEIRALGLTEEGIRGEILNSKL